MWSPGPADLAVASAMTNASQRVALMTSQLGQREDDVRVLESLLSKSQRDADVANGMRFTRFIWYKYVTNEPIRRLLT